MHTAEIRLECLKLALRAGLSPDEVLAIARVYLGWVDGMPAPITPKGPVDSQKGGKPAPSVPERTSPLKQTAGKPAS